MDVQGGLPASPQSGLSHVPAAIASGRRVGPLAREREMTLTLVLAPRDPDGLRVLAQAGSARTVVQIDAAHRPDAATVRRVVAWCTAHGLAARAGADGYLVEARAGAPDVERAFAVRLDQYSVGHVRGHAPRSEPRLGPEIAADVLAVLGLANLARPWRGRRLRPGGAAGAGGPSSGAGYLPADIRTAYGLADAAGGVDGRGVTVAIFEFGSAFTRGDVQAFWQLAGVRPPNVRVEWALGPGQATPPAGPSLAADVEATSDVEWVGALAPGADLVVVNAMAGAGADSFAQALARAISHTLGLRPLPSVVSISYGDAEAFFSAADLVALDALYARAAAAGVTVLVASGDSGAYGVPVSVGPLQSVDAPACLPHVLSVGGTHLELSGAVVAREVAWSDVGGGNGASGGGVSQVFEPAPWQDAARIAAVTGGRHGRGVPDVAGDADPATGYRIVVAGSLAVVGGTSLATPVWAAALALVNQVRRASGQAALGLVGPQLYALGARSSRIRDILVGDNAFLSATGYRCATGWDAVTGLGTPAGPALWQALAGPDWPVPAVRAAQTPGVAAVAADGAIDAPPADAVVAADAARTPASAPAPQKPPPAAPMSVAGSHGSLAGPEPGPEAEPDAEPDPAPAPTPAPGPVEASGAAQSALATGADPAPTGAEVAAVPPAVRPSAQVRRRSRPPDRSVVAAEGGAGAGGWPGTAPPADGDAGQGRPRSQVGKRRSVANPGTTASRR